jgi:VanZ family protein
VNRQSLELARTWYGLGALMLVTVAVLSLIPIPAESVPGGDKVAHLVTYAALGAWFSLLVDRAAQLVWSVAGLIGFGVLMEGLQALTGYRFAEWADVVANTSGVLLGTLFYLTPAPKLLRFFDARLAGLIGR